MGYGGGGHRDRSGSVAPRKVAKVEDMCNFRPTPFETLPLFHSAAMPKMTQHGFPARMPTCHGTVPVVSRIPLPPTKKLPIKFERITFRETVTVFLLKLNRKEFFGNGNSNFSGSSGDSYLGSGNGKSQTIIQTIFSETVAVTFSKIILKCVFVGRQPS